VSNRYAITIVYPPGNVHSRCFLEPAALFYHGLRALGHEAVVTTSGNLPGYKHIIFGANLLPGHHMQVASDAIILEAEQPKSAWFGPEYLALLRGHEVWECSFYPAEWLRSAHGIESKVVLYGSVPEMMGLLPRVEPTVDVFISANPSPRRMKIVEGLRAAGLSVDHVMGVYGSERDRRAAQAKVILGVHCYEVGAFETWRTAYMMMQGKCVVQEVGVDRASEEMYGPGCVLCRYEDLVETCRRYVEDAAARAEMEAAGPELMRSLPMTRFLAVVL
jgi:hypothetical protein